MKIKNTLLILTILILPMLTVSCGRSFSVSNPDIRKLTASAQMLMAAEDYKGAAVRLEAINVLNPNLPENNYNLGIAYYRMNEREKAIASMNKALELRKNLPDAYYTLAVIYEDIALEKTTGLEKEKDAQKKADTITGIADSYQKAIDNYDSYLKLTKDPEEQAKVQKKIDSLREDQEKITKGASEEQH
jgi:tetratricopeptide (TPR) repeat protein